MPVWGGQKSQRTYTRLTDPGSYSVMFKWIKQKGLPKFNDPSDRLTLVAETIDGKSAFYSGGRWNEHHQIERDGAVLAGDGILSNSCRAWALLRSLEKACQVAQVPFGYGDLSGVWVLEVSREEWFGMGGNSHILLVSKVYSRGEATLPASQDASEKAPGATINPSPDALATQVVNTLLEAAGGSYVLSEYTAGDMADLVPGTTPRALKVTIGRKALDREWLAEHGYIVDQAGKVLDKLLPF